eukprot:ANDGO_06781.mRNA.1 Beta-adaptin-like protein A
MSYFSDQKKGEIYELKQSLRNAHSEKDHFRRRDVVKKVVALMTMGVDVSSLFSEMIMLCSTQDMVQKKMVYLYMTQYAHSNQDIALLTVSALQRDFKDYSPVVRGLALRTFSSLRIKSTVEYLKPMIMSALLDSSAYVRAAAVMACLKLFNTAPSLVEVGGDLRSKLRTCLGDRDKLVVANAVAVLVELGETLDRAAMHALLNDLQNFSEWHQCRILDLLASYMPESAEEALDIMDLVDDLFMSSNSAVVLGATRALIVLTADMSSKVQKKVMGRIREPLLTFAICSSSELSYSVLTHIKLLCARSPSVFSSDYRLFFVQYADPLEVRLVKLDILAKIATEHTCNEIINEISQYVIMQRQTIFSNHAVKTMGSICLSVPDALQTVLKALQSFVDYRIPHVVAASLCQLRDLLRRFPPRADIIPLLEKLTKLFLGSSSILSSIESSGEEFVNDVGNNSVNTANAYSSKAIFTEATCALLWLLGEFGRALDDAPYVCEAFSLRFSDLESSVRLELLSTCMKLFFVRPPEVQPTLGRVLKIAVEDFSHADVHDRGLLYYRLLKRDISAAQAVVVPQKQVVERFAEDESSAIRERLFFEEFNTLSVVFDIPSERFLFTGTGLAGALRQDEEEEETVVEGAPRADGGNGDVDDGNASEEDEQDEQDEEEQADDRPRTGNVFPGASSQARSQQSVSVFEKHGVNFSSLVDPSSSGGSNSSPSNTRSPIASGLPVFDSGPKKAPSSSAPGSSAPQPRSFQLDPNFSLDPATFQKHWGTFEQCAPLQVDLQTTDIDTLEADLAEYGITCMAKGAMGDFVKAFFYARDTAIVPSTFLVELIVDPEGSATAKVKSSVKLDAEKSFSPLLRKVLSSST